MRNKKQPRTSEQITTTRRLLILDDRRKDVDLLTKRPPIREYFHSGDVEPVFVRTVEALKRDETAIKKATIVVAETMVVAVEIIKQQSFDFVISDLLLFDPDKVNAPFEQKKEKKPRKNATVNADADNVDAVDALSAPDYFAGLPLEDQGEWSGRRTQITRPAGVTFLSQLRLEDRPSGTSRNVPVVAMTFFWRHPRFDALYVEQLRQIPGAPIGYLPKYYWVGNTRIGDKGDKALKLLIKLLGPGADNSVNEELVPMLFDAVALDLFVYKNRFDLHDAMGALRESYHTSCRAILDFTFIFHLGDIPVPRPHSRDPFTEIMDRLVNDVDVKKIKIAFKFDNLPKATESEVGTVKERKLNSKDFELLRIAGPKDDRNIRKFVICLALALYTYPLAYEPHCLNTQELADLLTKALKLKEKIDRHSIATDINSIRDNLQKALPAEIREFVSAKNHLIVSHGHDGYYLNGSYMYK
jgi:hypothetical protein